MAPHLIRALVDEKGEEEGKKTSGNPLSLFALTLIGPSEDATA